MRTKIQKLMSHSEDVRHAFVKTMFSHIDYNDKYRSDICKDKFSHASVPDDWSKMTGPYGYPIAEITFRDTIGNQLNTKLRNLTNNLSPVTVAMWENVIKDRHIVCHLSKDKWFDFVDLIECISGYDQSVRLQIQKIIFEHLT